MKPRPRLTDIDLFLMDMDGTIYHENEIIPGALEFFSLLRLQGKHYAFMTNNSSKGRCTTLYGPVMANAWHTLTTKAYSCRIIIEQSIFKIVSSRDSYGPGEDGDWLPWYARRDYDGQAIFDYLAFDPILGKDTIKAKGIVEDMKQSLVVIDQFATKLAAVYYNHDNSTSVRLAVALFDYVIESISRWTGQEAIEIIRELPGRDKIYGRIMEAIHKEE